MSSVEARLTQARDAAREKFGFGFHRHFLEEAPRVSPDDQVKAIRFTEYLRQRKLFAVETEFREWREFLVQWGLTDKELKPVPDNWILYMKDLTPQLRIEPIEDWGSWKTTLLKYIPLMALGSWLYLAN
ncbi:hypothetical protein B0J14DRAFT_657264 [Halenospora varia]|nr:hypothetical protein B0J14DRAFT_657264 [Halenospora varia]